MTNTSIIRDIQLGISTGDYSITLDANQLPGKWYFLFNKQRKIIKDLIDRGAILTGSRALVCYKVNNAKIFNRKPNDWDFIMTTDQFIKLCKDYKIYSFDLSNPTYHLNKSFASFSDGYGNRSHWFKCLIQIIIKDDLPQFVEHDEIKFESLSSIIKFKSELASPPFPIPNHAERAKHQSDLNNILVNIYAL